MAVIEKCIWFVIFLHSLVSILAQPFSDCITPPLECPNENITFYLYTRSNKDNPHELKVADKQSITKGPWVKDTPIKILIHGYTGWKDYAPNPEIRPAYMECCDYNVISVDYNPLAREPCYYHAAKNTQLVGMCTAQLIDALVQDHGFPLTLFHVIGYSLGGQTAGYIGNYLKSGSLERITGLDPALPLFITVNNSKKLDASDAKFVDVLHTNALERGKLESCGTIDFYANGGLTQPGCKNDPNRTKSSCDHARAPEYFAESITSEVGFYGTKCPSWIMYMIGWCEIVDDSEEILFGEYIPYGSNGLYFFDTNSKSPYAQGSRKKNSSSSTSSSDGNNERRKRNLEEYLSGQSEGPIEAWLETHLSKLKDSDFEF